MKSEKVKVSVTLDNEIVQKIKDMAEADERSFSQFINLLLKNYIDSRRRSEW